MCLLLPHNKHNLSLLACSHSHPPKANLDPVDGICIISLNVLFLFFVLALKHVQLCDELDQTGLILQIVVFFQSWLFFGVSAP